MPDIAILIPILIIVIYLISSIKILAEYERGVVFRLGRVLSQPKGPGVILVFAPIDRMVRISLRIEAMEVPAQDIITRDNVTVKVNAVVYFRVVDPSKAVLEVTNFLYATSQVSQTTLRSVLGEVELDELLSQREKLNLRLQSVLDTHTGPWGVKVTVVEVKQVDLAEQMIRAIARQAEAERERRAKVIHAEGEYIVGRNSGPAVTAENRNPTSKPIVVERPASEPSSPSPSAAPPAETAAAEDKEKPSPLPPTSTHPVETAPSPKAESKADRSVPAARAKQEKPAEPAAASPVSG